MITKSLLFVKRRHAQFLIIGSGPAEEIPRRGCRCALCNDARQSDSQSQRTRSSAILQYKGKNILFDCSPDFLEQIRQAKVRHLDALFLSHAHFDAIGGLGQLQKWLQGQQLPVFTEKLTWGRIQKKFKILDCLQPFFCAPRKKLYFAGLTILPLRVQHSIQPGFPTLAFKIFLRNKTLIYAEDVGNIPMRDQKYWKNVDYLLLDAAMYFGKQIKGHFNTEEAITLAKKLKAKRLFLLQAGHTYPPYRQAQKEIKKYWQKIRGSSKMQIFLTFDQMRVKII